jgi:hypothetical protein
MDLAGKIEGILRCIPYLTTLEVSPAFLEVVYFVGLSTRLV